MMMMKAFQTLEFELILAISLIWCHLVWKKGAVEKMRMIMAMIKQHEVTLSKPQTMAVLDSKKEH
jgi:hypothetical protein